MPKITDLPCEIVNAVLRRVGSLQNLSSALLSCRHVYTSFRETPHVAADILLRLIGPALLPSVSRLAALPFPVLLEVNRTHDAIHSFVTAFSNSAWAHLCPQDGGSVSLSPKEHVRFCRAFYRMELYFRLFQRPRYTDYAEHGGPAYLRTFPNWENEQIGCAHDFLELQFSKASREVLAHDVYFGEVGVDYLTSGGMNLQRQTWLAQGTNVVHQLMTETTYDARRALLEATFFSGHTDLDDALIGLYEGGQLDDDIALEDYSDKEREALFRPSEPRLDADRGPFDAWWAPNKDCALGSTLMMASNAGYRERAYVLWDEARLQQHSLLALFVGDGPKTELEQEYTSEEYNAMIESFDARSKIDQRSGSGYWSKDDASRVVWRHGPPE